MCENYLTMTRFSTVQITTHHRSRKAIALPAYKQSSTIHLLCFALKMEIINIKPY